MALWFTEQHTDDVRFSIHIKEQLYSGKSYYQQIEVFDSYEFGRVLVLDGYIMLTEKDEYISLGLPRSPSSRAKDCTPRNFTGTALRRSGSMAF